ncbi:hypothetical protein [Spirosoma oryzae]|uniref:hypothetical protein n=1 Tax=Spirosoma oryzae TaxID=1469603 RepID=UPI0011B25E72|nr:hypothetical protein [Spirosoma oryzae]
MDTIDRVIKVCDYQEYEYKGYTIKRLDYLSRSEESTLQFYPTRKWMYFFEGMYQPKAQEPGQTNELKPQKMKSGDFRLGYWDGKVKQMVILVDFVPDCGVFLSDEDRGQMAAELNLPMYWRKYEYNEADWDVD